MPNVNEAYKRIEDLESKLRFDLRKAFFPEQNFQAYADYSREYLKALGKEVDFNLVEQAVRDSLVMKKVFLKLDKVRYSYNDLVRDITTVRRDGIAKSLVSAEGADDVHSLTSVFIKYGIDPKEDFFSKAVYLISQTGRSAIEQKYSENVLVRRELLIPNRMNVQEFIFLINGYATSALKNEVQKNAA